MLKFVKSVVTLRAKNLRPPLIKLVVNFIADLCVSVCSAMHYLEPGLVFTAPLWTKEGLQSVKYKLCIPVWLHFYVEKLFLRVFFIQSL